MRTGWQSSRARKKAASVEVKHITGINHLFVPAKSWRRLGISGARSEIDQSGGRQEHRRLGGDRACAERKIDYSVWRMRVGIPKRTGPAKLASRSFRPALAALEGGARRRDRARRGRSGGFPDAAYSQQGAVMLDRREILSNAEILLTIRASPLRATTARTGYHRLRRPSGRAAVIQDIARAAAVLFSWS